MRRLERLYLYHYKKVIIFPIILLILSIIVLGIQQARTGSIINRDISLQGGISATITTEHPVDIQQLEQGLRTNFPDSDINVRELGDLTTGKKIGILVELTNAKNDQLQPFLEKQLGISLTSQNYSVEEIGASLSSSFFRELILTLIFSFLFMSIVVFIAFRKVVPSTAVIFTAFTDIVVTLAIVSIINLRISTAGVAAFLLLIGYSIDTDILLTTKVLKRTGGSLFDRMYSSIKTGLMMTLTAVVAVTIGLILSNSLVLKQIFTIILIGLLVDVIATYGGNAPALVWYCKKKNIQ